MKIIKDIILKTSKFLTFKNRIYLDKNNKEQSWQMVSRNNETKAVGIIAITKDNKLVVTREFRVPINNFEYGMPAGLIDEGETIQQTAIREMKEETGLNIIEIFKTSPFIYNSAGMTDESIALIFVKVDGEINNELLGTSEDITTMLMSQEQVKTLLTNNIAFGAKAWIVLNQFATYGTII